MLLLLLPWCCLQRKELVRITPRTPLFGPLRHKLPLQGFSTIRVVVSGYPADARRTINTLVQLLGGSVCATLVKSSPATHLILPRWGPDDPAGADDAAAAAGTQGGDADLSDSTVKKVLFALRHGVHMVAAEWLVECAHEGKRLNELHFRPAGNQHLLPAPTASQALQSQLGQTQTGGSAVQVGMWAGRGGLHSRWHVTVEAGSEQDAAGRQSSTARLRRKRWMYIMVYIMVYIMESRPVLLTSTVMCKPGSGRAPPVATPGVVQVP